MSELIDDERLRAQLTERGLKETAELLAFLDKVALKLSDALEDNKVSLVEIVEISVSVVPRIRQALLGLAQVPEELKNLVDSPENIELLADVIMPDVFAKSPPFVSALVNALIGLLREIVHVLAIYKNRNNWENPPKANIVQ